MTLCDAANLSQRSAHRCIIAPCSPHDVSPTPYKKYNHPKNPLAFEVDIGDTVGRIGRYGRDGQTPPLCGASSVAGSCVVGARARTYTRMYVILRGGAIDSWHTHSHAHTNTNLHTSLHQSSLAQRMCIHMLRNFLQWSMFVILTFVALAQEVGMPDTVVLNICLFLECAAVGSEESGFSISGGKGGSLFALVAFWAQHVLLPSLTLLPADGLLQEEIPIVVVVPGQL